GDAHGAFGALDVRQLNWRPDAKQWSVAQCLDHLLTANRLIVQFMEAAADSRHPRTTWQRLPLLPGVIGRLMIRSHAPANARKFSAPPPAQPAVSDSDASVVQRFVAQQHDLAARAASLDDPTGRAIMTSPFIGFVAYSVLDGWRLVVAHDQRHLEQA